MGSPWDCSSVVELLPSMLKVLGSISKTTKKKNAWNNFMKRDGKKRYSLR
jgi:hypothetical protein